MNHQNQAAGQAESPLASFEKAKREKAWDECGIEEKVERLRMQLLRVRESQQYIGRNASEARDLAVSHQHNPATGEVLRPARERSGGAEIGGSSFDPLR